MSITLKIAFFKKIKLRGVWRAAVHGVERVMTVTEQQQQT